MMGFQFDYNRISRIGMPEAVLCEGKDTTYLNLLLEEIITKPDHPVLLTRLSVGLHSRLRKPIRSAMDYDSLSRTGVLNGRMQERKGSVGIITAGTSDMFVAMEAERTIQFLGFNPRRYEDIGVAGLWRFVEKKKEIEMNDVLIVVAGMDAALATVIAGEIGKPIIGVPTSIGYGTAKKGRTAMNAMLTSCAQGLLVTNIDNGFGAACAATRILRTVKVSAE